MWADMNNKPLQGMKFRVLRGQVVGSPVEYDDKVERWRTHHLLMSKIEPMSLSWDDTEVLKKVEVIMPGV